MAGFNFDQVDKFVSNDDKKIEFLKLEDDGWYAKVRFMYGPGEMFQGETVHNVSEDPTRPRWVVCLREEGDPVDVCPLCANKTKISAQFYIPVYVESIVSNVRGVEQETPVGRVMVCQKGSTFKGALQTVVRYTKDTGRPIVSSKFRLVRNGKARDSKTTYSVEYISTDDITLEQLPPRPEVKGSYILPNPSYDEMVSKYINKQPAATAQQVTGIQPRTLSANSFGANTVGFAQPAASPVIPAPQVQPAAPSIQPMNNTNQAPNIAPTIGTGATPF